MGQTPADPLLAGLTAGDEQAFAALYDRLSERLYRAAAAMLGRRQDAEDAVQDVFLSLVRSRARLASVRDVSAYAFAALRHACGRIADRRARQPPAASAEASLAATAPGPAHMGDPAGRCESAEALAEALRALPPEQRAVVALKIDGGLTFAQIAEVLAISPNTAASRYRYALEKLRSALKD